MKRFMLILILTFFHCRASEKPGRANELWSQFEESIGSANSVQFRFDDEKLKMLYAAEVQQIMASCAVLGCEVIRVNELTFFMPLSPLVNEPFKHSLEQLTAVKSAEDMPRLLDAHKDEVCFVWAGHFVDFIEVLKLAKVLSQSKRPFYFCVREDIKDIRVSFY